MGYQLERGERGKGKGEKGGGGGAGAGEVVEG